MGLLHIRFAWDAATDAQTPSGALSYDVRVGSAPGMANIVAPPASVATGQRRVAVSGRIKATDWLITVAVCPRGRIIGVCKQWTRHSPDHRLRPRGAL
jgi:hypothetical protein